MSTLNVQTITGLSNSISVGNSTINTVVNSTAISFSGYVPTFEPGGRLTLAANTPVMSSSYSAQTAVYYTPYVNDMIPLWNGSNFIPTKFTEISQATTDTTKSPTAVANDKIYDVFVWNDVGTIRATRGPAWTSGTDRGSGAGTTEIYRVNGIFVNKYDITNGPSAGYGTYVGTIACVASNAIDFYLGGSASGGSKGQVNVWNRYNRVQITAASTDNGANYTYSSATIRQARNSVNNAVSFVTGSGTDTIFAVLTARADLGAASGSGQYVYMGIQIDSSSTYLYKEIIYEQTAAYRAGEICMSGVFAPVLGYHTISSNESSDGTHNGTMNFSSSNNIRVSLWV